jgi:hypothetical protein
MQYGGVAPADAGYKERTAFRSGPRLSQYLKTEALVMNPYHFAIKLQHEIDSLLRYDSVKNRPDKVKIDKKTGEELSRTKFSPDGYESAIRLNVTSDLDASMWEGLIANNKDVQFYDYTKHPARNLQGKTSGNYDLTYSFSAVTPKPITIKGLQNPNNSRVAVVFQKQADIPASFRGWDVIDGDNTDVRHIEPKQVVVALYAKGKAKRDTSGFTQILGVHYA